MSDEVVGRQGETLDASDARIRVDSESGCWEWLRTKTDGYGRMMLNSKNVRAHRVFYEHANGPIPAGLVTDHVCRNRGCVNPNHIRVVTARENNMAPGSLSRTALNAAKERCPRCGGEFRRTGRGERVCQSCKNAKNREYRRMARNERERAQPSRLDVEPE